MGLRDLKNNVSVTQSLAPAIRKLSADGTYIDLQGAKSAMVVFHVGAYTNGDFTLQVKESDDSGGSGATVVAAADLEGAFVNFATNAQQNKAQRVGYKGTKRYIAASLLENSGSPAPGTGCAIGASVCFEPNAKPAA